MITPHHRVAKWAGIFLLTAVPLAYAHDGYDIVLYVKLLVAQFGALLMMFAWLIGSIRGDIPHRRSPLDLPLLLFLLIHVLSWATMAINPFSSGIEVVKLFTFVLLYFAVSRTFHTSFIKPWTYVIAIVTALVSIMGICQYLGVGFLWLRTTGYPSATFVYRNFAAMYLIMAIPLAVIPFLNARSWQAEWIWGLLAATSVIFLIYTRTRGAWVGLACALLLVGVICWFCGSVNRQALSSYTKRKWIFSICFLLIISIFAQAQPNTPEIPDNFQKIPSAKIEIASTLTSILEKQDSGRSIVWKHTLEMIRDDWLTGVGLGNWELIYPVYDRGEILSPGYYARRPHNDILWIWAETGILGLAVFCSILFVTAFLQFHLFRKLTPSRARHLIPFLAISLVAIVGHACFSFPRERIPPLLFTYLILGIISALHIRQMPVRKHTKLQFMPPILGALCMMCVIGLTYRTIEFDKLHYALLQKKMRNDWESVIHTADQALKFGVINHWVLIWKAHALKMQGNPERALEVYRKCLNYHPNEESVYWEIGLLERSIGNLSHAQKALEQAVFLDADNANFRQDLGAVYQLQNKFDDALQAYHQALSLGATDPHIYLNLAGIYEELTEDGKAAQFYKQFLQAWQGDTATADSVRNRLHSLENN